MSYPMVHLCIAYDILNTSPQISNPCDFILGSLAPDSVHFEENYYSDMKKKSHLCVGDEKWGEITNNQEWLENVLTFLYKNNHIKKMDFIYGFCTHIITDIQTNMKITLPFRSAHKYEIEKGAGRIYGQELYSIDYELYVSHPKREAIWHMLEDATGYDIPNVVTLEGIEKMKHDILNNQFLSRKSLDIISYKYFTLSDIRKFIFIESQYIKKLIYKKANNYEY